MMRFVFVFLAFILCLSLDASDAKKIRYIETNGVIITIDNRYKSNQSYVHAEVDYKTKDGAELSGVLRLFYIPFVGTFKKPGDIVKVYYEEQNPARLQTIEGTFLEKYGTYFLIILILVLATGGIRKLYRSYSSIGQSNF